MPVKDPGAYTDKDNSLSQHLKDKLQEYKKLIDAEIKKAKTRSLEIHNTTRESYQRQSDLIADLLDEMEEGEEIIWCQRMSES